MKKSRKIILAAAISLVILGIGIFFSLKAGRFQKSEKISVKIPQESPSLKLEAVSFITPHHLAAEELIDGIFKKAAEINKKARVERIVLLSPNHENISRGWAIVAEKDWMTKGDLVEADKKAIALLREKKSLFALDNEAFEKEHGISNLLPYVKKHFPSAKIVPIMIRDGLPQKKAEEILEVFAQNFETGTMVILSADFSHYIGQTAGRMHDQESLRAIESFDYEKMQKLGY